MAIRDVNLIPGDMLHRRRVGGHLIFWGGCLAMVLAVISGWFLYETVLVLPQKRPVATVADVQKHLGATIEDIRVTEGELERLNLQEAFLEKFTGNQSFAAAMQELSQSLTHMTWLNKLEIQMVEDENRSAFRRLQLYGFSVSNDELGEFLTRLAGNPALRKVILKFAREARVGVTEKKKKRQAKVIQFQIDVDMKGA